MVSCEVAEGGGPVAGPLRCDAEPFFAGEVDDLADVVDRLRDGDGRRLLVDREVPGLARGVPPGVSGGDDVAVDEPTEVAEIG